MAESVEEVLVLDGILYGLSIAESERNYSAMWNCPLCHASGRTEESGRANEEFIKEIIAAVVEHHTQNHATVTRRSEKRVFSEGKL